MIRTDYSSETLKARSTWNNKFQVQKGTSQTRTLYPAKKPEVYNIWAKGIVKNVLY